MNSTRARATTRRTHSGTPYAGDLIGLCIPFVASALSGIVGRSYMLGELPEPFRTIYKDDQRRGILYTVVSYETPIAWLTVEGWKVPGVRYSQTTGRHQSAVRYALNMTYLQQMTTGTSA